MTAEVPSAPAPTSSACPAEIALDDPRLRAWRAFLFAQAAEEAKKRFQLYKKMAE